MAKKIPTAAEVREYLEKEDEYRNSDSYIITGAKFPGENIWKSDSTLPLLEAAEKVGTPNEEIWKLCSKLSQTTHAPVTKKDYERMLPFAESPGIVDAVLKFLETYVPPFQDSTWSLKFDIKGYYYCLALISLSDYRQEACEKQLWNTVYYHLENDKNKGDILLRNMKMLEGTRPNLIPMKEKLIEAQNSNNG